jgi:hypothetical protein
MTTNRPKTIGGGEGTTTANVGIGHNRAPALDPPDWVELQRVVDPKEAARLSDLSIDTIKRHHASKIIELSPRRRGMRLGDALSLSV